MGVVSLSFLNSLMLSSKSGIIFIFLCGIFITSAIVAELISCKLADIGLFFPIIAGIVPWPVVFLLTDVMNEFYGRKAVRRISWITCAMIVYCFIIVFVAVQLPTAEGSFATDEEFSKLFGGSLPIMVGSIVAFVASQMIDVRLFWVIRKLTGERWIWLRSTGSTVVSQLCDSFIVLIIGFWLPSLWGAGKYTLAEVGYLGITGYSVKLIIAILLTPLIYLLRNMVRKFLGEEEAEKMATEAAIESYKKEK